MIKPTEIAVGQVWLRVIPGCFRPHPDAVSIYTWTVTKVKNEGKTTKNVSLKCSDGARLQIANFGLMSDEWELVSAPA